MGAIFDRKKRLRLSLIEMANKGRKWYKDRMGYEIDFLPVGDGNKSGDAICLRYGNLAGPRAEQTVITIDGGTMESGDALISHIATHYKTDHVDIAFVTHPDGDHASGMRQIIENLRVGQLAMHLPWNHSEHVKVFLADTRPTTDSITKRARSNLSAVRDIEALAKKKNVPIVEPFAGTRSQKGLTVLGPTPEFYRQAFANFRFMPGTPFDDIGTAMANAMKGVTEAVGLWLDEHHFLETLREPALDATSAENNSSVIFLLEIEGRKLLFTGDAGVPALSAAINFAQHAGISLVGINLFQVPHHGSRHNIGPGVLNYLFGNIRATDTRDWAACVSAAPDGPPKHPHRKVTNALRRRGANVAITAGRTLCYSFNAVARPGWTPVAEVPFYDKVENDD